MERDVVVRRATSDDLPILARLYDEYRQFYGCPADPDLARDFLTARLADQSSIIFIATDPASDPIGFAQLYPTFCSVEACRILILYDLFVDAGRRGGGVCGALLDTVVVYAGEQGYGRIDLRTATTNENAQRLYERKGWARVNWLYDYSRAVVA